MSDETLEDLENSVLSLCQDDNTDELSVTPSDEDYHELLEDVMALCDSEIVAKQKDPKLHGFAAWLKTTYKIHIHTNGHHCVPCCEPAEEGYCVDNEEPNCIPSELADDSVLLISPLIDTEPDRYTKGNNGNFTKLLVPLQESTPSKAYHETTHAGEELMCTKGNNGNFAKLLLPLQESTPSKAYHETTHAGEELMCKRTSKSDIQVKMALEQAAPLESLTTYNENSSVALKSSKEKQCISETGTISAEASVRKANLPSNSEVTNSLTENSAVNACDTVNKCVVDKTDELRDTEGKTSSKQPKLFTTNFMMSSANNMFAIEKQTVAKRNEYVVEHFDGTSNLAPNAELIVGSTTNNENTPGIVRECTGKTLRHLSVAINHLPLNHLTTSSSSIAASKINFGKPAAKVSCINSYVPSNEKLDAIISTEEQLLKSIDGATCEKCTLSLEYITDKGNLQNSANEDPVYFVNNSGPTKHLISPLTCSTPNTTEKKKKKKQKKNRKNPETQVSSLPVSVSSIEAQRKTSPADNPKLNCSSSISIAVSYSTNKEESSESKLNMHGTPILNTAKALTVDCTFSSNEIDSSIAETGQSDNQKDLITVLNAPTTQLHSNNLNCSSIPSVGSSSIVEAIACDHGTMDVNYTQPASAITTGITESKTGLNVSLKIKPNLPMHLGRSQSAIANTSSHHKQKCNSEAKEIYKEHTSLKMHAPGQNIPVLVSQNDGVQTISKMQDTPSKSKKCDFLSPILAAEKMGDQVSKYPFLGTQNAVQSSPVVSYLDPAQGCNGTQLSLTEGLDLSLDLLQGLSRISNQTLPLPTSVVHSSPTQFECRFPINNQSSSALSVPVHTAPSLIPTQFNCFAVPNSQLSTQQCTSVNITSHSVTGITSTCSMPASFKLDFVSDDPNENKDNSNPNWDVLRMLATDDDRYRAVRQRWRNILIPDPCIDLSSQTYLLRCVQASQGGNLLPTAPASRKRPATGGSLQSQAKRCKREVSCTEKFDSQLHQLEEFFEDRRNRMNEDFYRTRSNLIRAVEMTERCMQQSGYGCSSLYQRYLSRHQFACNSLADLEESHKRKLEDFANEFESNTKKLRTARHEVFIFHAFYANLKNSTNANEDTTKLNRNVQQEMHECDDMYEQYSRFYGCDRN